MGKCWYGSCEHCTAGHICKPIRQKVALLRQPKNLINPSKIRLIEPTLPASINSRHRIPGEPIFFSINLCAANEQSSAALGRILQNECKSGRLYLGDPFRRAFCGGARLCGNGVTILSRWSRIFLITTESLIQAIISTAPPHCSQVSISILSKIYETLTPRPVILKKLPLLWMKQI